MVTPKPDSSTIARKTTPETKSGIAKKQPGTIAKTTTPVKTSGYTAC
ncbi:hypothetical protein [Paraflavitalea speifideaquila]|nr:hypothetical protein [Paraflavitalea speifideiaquila]